jgi:hypothetical protein
MARHDPQAGRAMQQVENPEPGLRFSGDST